MAVLYHAICRLKKRNFNSMLQNAMYNVSTVAEASSIRCQTLLPFVYLPYVACKVIIY